MMRRIFTVRELYLSGRLGVFAYRTEGMRDVEEFRIIGEGETSDEDEIKKVIIVLTTLLI